MTALDLPTLKRLAQAATPGPWAWFGNTKVHQMYLSTVDRGRQYVMQFVRWGTQSAQPRFQRDGVMVPASGLVEYEVDYRQDIAGINHPDAAYIAAANPSAILELIERCERAEAERDAFKAEIATARGKENKT